MHFNTKQEDRYYCSNTVCKFASSIKVKGYKGSVYRAKGKLIGTTYSGHPTCTTLCGTLRNLFYHLFGIFRRNEFFSDKFEQDINSLELF